MSDVQLGVRAFNVLRNLGVERPADLDAAAESSGLTVPSLLLRIPNCGRKTARQIQDWYNEGKTLPFPTFVWVRIDKDVSGHWRAFNLSNTPTEGENWYRARIEIGASQRSGLISGLSGGFRDEEGG